MGERITMKINKLPAFVLGKNPICNRDHTKAPHICGFCFPLCWRCLGALVGFFIVGVKYFYCHNSYSSSDFFIGVLLVIPALLHYMYCKSKRGAMHNAIRFITGILLGVGITNLFT